MSTSEYKTIARWAASSNYDSNKSLLRGWNTLYRPKHKRQEDQSGGRRAFDAFLSSEGITWESLHKRKKFIKSLHMIYDLLTPEGGDLLGAARIVAVCEEHFGEPEDSVLDSLSFVGVSLGRCCRWSHFGAWLVYMLGGDEDAYSSVVEMLMAIRSELGFGSGFEEGLSFFTLSSFFPHTVFFFVLRPTALDGF